MMSKPAAIHIWGDSIGKGILFDESRGRYVISQSRSSDCLQAALGITIENHARMGATVTTGLADLERKSPDAASVVAIEYGGNDCDLLWAEVAAAPDQPHAAKVPLDQFRLALTHFVNQIQNIGAIPLLVTPPPLDARRYFAWVTRGLDAKAVLRYLGDVQHIYRWQERYALVVRDVAQATGCAIFDVRSAFLSQRDVSRFLCIDGIHPNALGQELITQTALTQAALSQNRESVKSFSVI